MAKMTRRGLLVAGGLLAVGGAAVLSQHVEVPSPTGSANGDWTSGSMVRFDKVGGGRLGYEGTGQLTSMRADDAFLDLLHAWAEDWAALSGLGAIQEVWSYGAYTDKAQSWHSSGRAFDFARVVHSDGSVSCRFDQWAPGTDSQRRDYWRLAASLHEHFAYTLTHLYNEQHNNHIHVDNSISGDQLSTFNQRSRVQVQLVQAALRHVHGYDVEVTSSYDAQTTSALRDLQRSLDITRPLADAHGWRAFLRATASS